MAWKQMRITHLSLIFVLVASLLAGCSSSGPGSVSGQIKRLTPEGGVENLAGAQVILRGAQDTRTAVSTAGEGSGEQAEASYNYRFDNVPPGTYTMAVTPPPGSGLQPETDITLEVKADEQFPQSVMLLPEGTARPRPLTPGELNPGEVGYVNGRGERVVHQQGSGFDVTDALLLYLIMRNPPGFGYGAPPVIVNNPAPAGSNTPRYRTETPRTTTTTGQRVTQRPPAVPGQGATRPGAAPASGPGPSTGSGSSGAASKNGTVPSSGVGGVSKNGTSGSSPNGSSGVRSPSDSAPSQGVTRPSGSSRPSAPAPSRSSGGSRSGGGRR